MVLSKSNTNYKIKLENDKLLLYFVICKVKSNSISSRQLSTTYKHFVTITNSFRLNGGWNKFYLQLFTI